MVEVRQFQVYLVALDPAKGAEIQKTRPCIVISPDEINRHFRTVIIAPMTTKGFTSYFRVPTTFKSKKGLVLLDHIRSVDKHRLLKKLDMIDEETARKICAGLQEMFAY